MSARNHLQCQSANCLPNIPRYFTLFIKTVTFRVVINVVYTCAAVTFVGTEQSPAAIPTVFTGNVKQLFSLFSAVFRLFKSIQSGLMCSETSKKSENSEKP